MKAPKRDSVRFTGISTKTISYAQEINKSTDLTADCKVKIVQEAAWDYYRTLNMFLDFVIEMGDLGIKWTAAEVEGVKIVWVYNDMIDEWGYNLHISVKKPIQPDDGISLICHFDLPKVSHKDLPEDVKRNLELLFDEAWAYAFEDKAAQLSIVPELIREAA